MGSSAHTITMVTTKLLLASCGLLALVSSDFVGRSGRHNHNQRSRSGRQEEGQISGGIDFSGCEEDPDTGLCCVEKEERQAAEAAVRGPGEKEAGSRQQLRKPKLSLRHQVHLTKPRITCLGIEV